MTKEKIKGLLINNAREWIKEIAQDVAVIYVDDFIDELLSKLHQPTVISSACECKDLPKGEIVISSKALSDLTELIEELKPIKQNRLEELINALNTLGSLGIELDVKITAEVNGKKVEL